MLSGILILILSYIVYKLWLSYYYDKLNHIAGPWYSKYTNIIETYHRLCGKQFYYYMKLHEIYGPMVRVAPNRISFINSEAVQEIYQSYKYAKGPIYQIFTPFGDNLFSSGDRQFHQKRKKLLQNTFNNKSVLSMETMVHERGVLKLLEKMQNSKEKQCNLYQQIHLLTFDIIAELTFNKEFNTLEKLDDPIIHWLKSITIYAVLDGIFGIYRFIEPKCKRNLKEFILGCISDTKKENIKEGNTILTHFINARDDNGVGLTDQQLLAECLTQLIAGSDTTCNSIIWTIYLILKSPDAYKKIQSEIDKNFKSVDDVNYLDCKNKLVYMEAVIQEAMRLFPVSSGLLARTVPPGGVSINDTFIPENVEIGTCFYVYHRTNQFKNPEEFIPERWLNEEGILNRGKSLPFLIGPRACIGRELGWMEMYLIITSLFLTFDMQLDKSKDIEKLMQPEYFLVLRPKYSDLPIIFNKR
ncbi:cytochrome P450 [Neoconidiobolus thromboides FSU 785]|nr:cytochrome P450 [Neoconidiobolus thromboides FSU 785]